MGLLDILRYMVVGLVVLALLHVLSRQQNMFILGDFLLLCMGSLVILLTYMVVGLVILPLLHVHPGQLK